MSARLVLFKTIPTKLRRWIPSNCRGEVHLVDYNSLFVSGYGEHSCRRYYSTSAREDAIKCKGWIPIKVNVKQYTSQEVHDRSLYLKLKKQYEPESPNEIIDKLKEVISGD